MVCYCFQHGLWNIPILVDQVLESRLLQTQVKIDALCKQHWPPEQYPGKKFGNMLHLLCRQGSLGIVCLQHDSDYVCLWPGYSTTYTMTPRILWCRERVDRRVKWRSVVFSDESRFCLYASMDVHVHGVNLVSIIFRSTFAHDTRQASWCRARMRKSCY